MLTSPAAKTSKIIKSHRSREILDRVGYKDGQLNNFAYPVFRFLVTASIREGGMNRTSL